MKLIITADDFGISEDVNTAIVECAKYGILTDTCIMANGKAFNDAIQRAAENAPFINVGIHLDLFDENHNLAYINTLLKSYDKNFLLSVENEFRSQIEKVINSGIKPDSINSHVHIHSIPNIFEIVCKLAKEYNIQRVRTQSEKPYFAGNIKRHLTKAYILNIIKNILLNIFTILNKATLKKYGLDTNEYFIGVLYTGNMDSNSAKCGIKKVLRNNSAEIIFHPSIDENKSEQYKEYKTLLDEDLKAFINSITL